MSLADTEAGTKEGLTNLRSVGSPDVTVLACEKALVLAEGGRNEVTLPTLDAPSPLI